MSRLIARSGSIRQVQEAPTWIRRENAVLGREGFQLGDPGEYRFRETFCHSIVFRFEGGDVFEVDLVDYH